MLTTSATIDVKYVIRKSDVKVYSADTVHLDIRDTDGNRLINTSVGNPVVVTPQTPTVDGSIVFSSVPLALDGNQVKLFLSTLAGLDGAAVLTKLGSIYIKRLGIDPTEVYL